MRAGLRLRWFGEGNPDYQWGDLIAFVSGLPGDSALMRVVLGEDAVWSLTDDLLAIVADRLGQIHYALTARKGDEPPELLSRFAKSVADSPVDEVENLSDLAARDASGSYSAQVESIAEVARRLGWDISVS